MVFGLFRRKQSSIPFAVYGQIVEQSRNPVFYADLGVPDTIDGRFDMIALHLALVNRTLRKREAPLPQLSQEVFDVFAKDMDGSLREMGVGDQTVPKKMKAMAEVFYGRAIAYDAALDDGSPDALQETVARNIFPEDAEYASLYAQPLASYVRASEERLNGLPDDAFLTGRLDFPLPEPA